MHYFLIKCLWYYVKRQTGLLAKIWVLATKTLFQANNIWQEGQPILIYKHIKA